MNPTKPRKTKQRLEDLAKTCSETIEILVGDKFDKIHARIDAIESRMSEKPRQKATWLTHLKYTLRVFVTPSCWLQNHPYSKKWDTVLRDLLNKHTFEGGGEYTASLGGYVIWIENYPYACMHPSKGIKVRPKRSTVLWAFDRLIEDSLSNK